MCRFIAIFERLSTCSSFEQPFDDIQDLDCFDPCEYHLLEIIDCFE